MKKGVSLSVNVIIIAVLGLLILAILVFITSGKLGDFREGVDSCQPALCQEKADSCGDDMAAVPNKCKTAQDTEGNFCCVRIGNG